MKGGWSQGLMDPVRLLLTEHADFLRRLAFTFGSESAALTGCIRKRAVIRVSLNDACEFTPCINVNALLILTCLL